jgi:hypothetical protein
MHIDRKHDTCDGVVMFAAKPGYGETKRDEKRKGKVEKNVLTLIYNVSTDQSLRETPFEKMGLHEDERHT